MLQLVMPIERRCPFERSALLIAAATAPLRTTKQTQPLHVVVSICFSGL